MGPTRRGFSIGALSASSVLGFSGRLSAQSGPIRIGLILELSGPGVTFGVPAKRAADMVADAFGHQLAGRPLEFVVRDTQTDAQTAIASMKELADQQKLSFIVGPYASSIMASVIPSWRQSRPLWISVSSAPNIESEVGGENLFYHVFPFGYAYHTTASAALRHYLGPDKTISVIYGDDTFGRSHIDYVRKYYPEAGFKIISEDIIRTGSIDMRPVLSKVRGLKPDVLITLIQGADAVTVAKQIQLVRLDVPYLVGTASPQYPEWQEAVGAAQQGWLGLSIYIPGILDLPADTTYPKILPPLKAWEAEYQRRFGVQPDQLAACTYASLALLGLAIEKAGTDDKEKVAQALDSLKVSTFFGETQFHKSGETVHQAFDHMFMFQRQNGKSVVVYPLDIAQGQLIRAGT